MTQGVCIAHAIQLDPVKLCIANVGSASIVAPQQLTSTGMTAPAGKSAARKSRIEHLPIAGIHFSHISTCHSVSSKVPWKRIPLAIDVKRLTVPAA